ncbi:hypothetical protein MTO96_006887 [Rhipicephalus appendiculatus]
MTLTGDLSVRRSGTATTLPVRDLCGAGQDLDEKEKRRGRPQKRQNQNGAAAVYWKPCRPRPWPAKFIDARQFPRAADKTPSGVGSRACHAMADVGDKGAEARVPLNDAYGGANSGFLFRVPRTPRATRLAKAE